MNHTIPNTTRRSPAALSFLRIATAATALALAPGLALATPLGDMVAFDAVYIPALSMSTGASQDPRSVPKAQASIGQLERAWPELKRQLAGTWPGAAPAGWAESLASVERQIRAATSAAARADWKAAHEALEPVRITLMKARQAQGMDYYVDGLTAFHAPMETLALAGSTWQPGTLDSTRRAQLELAYAQARALWRGIEHQPIDAAAYGLPADKQAQLRQAIEEESAALARLSDALRGNDDAATLKAAAAIKPPFARAFTVFGRAEGERHAH